jgi:hypothetical protein
MQYTISEMLLDKHVTFELDKNYFKINEKTIKKYDNGLSSLLNFKQTSSPNDLKDKEIIPLEFDFCPIATLKTVLTFMETHQLDINENNAVPLWHLSDYLSFQELKARIEYEMRKYFRLYSKHELNVLSSEYIHFESLIKEIRSEQLLDESIALILDDAIFTICISLEQGIDLSSYSEPSLIEWNSWLNLFDNYNRILQSVTQSDLIQAEDKIESSVSENFCLGPLVFPHPKASAYQIINFYLEILILSASYQEIENDLQEENSIWEKFTQKLKEMAERMDQSTLFSLIITPTNLSNLYRKANDMLKNSIDLYFTKQKQKQVLSQQDHLLLVAYEDVQKKSSLIPYKII